MRPTSCASAASIAALALLFASSCAQLWMQRPVVDAGMDLTAIQTGQIVVWISSQTRNYSRAVAASFATDFPKGDLVERKIPPEDFVGALSKQASETVQILEVLLDRDAARTRLLPIDSNPGARVLVVHTSSSPVGDANLRSLTNASARQANAAMIAWRHVI